MSEIDPIDQNVGNVIRDLRKLAGLSLADLGLAVGVTYQQIQKYEHGTNRVSASMLFHISTVLDAPIAVFFDGLSRSEGDARTLCRSDAVAGQAFSRIPDAGVRTQLLSLMKALDKDD